MGRDWIYLGWGRRNGALRGVYQIGEVQARSWCFMGTSGACQTAGRSGSPMVLVQVARATSDCSPALVGRQLQRLLTLLELTGTSLPVGHRSNTV